MNRKLAYIDEYGAFGFQFDKPNVASHFIIAAIIINEEDIDRVTQGVQAIRKKYFQTGEMKSNKIGTNHPRRLKLLRDLNTLPYKIYAFVADKSKIYENSGLRYKDPFYKFLNNYVYQELRTNFNNLVICADEIGDNEFLSSFSKYVKSKELPLNLFDESSFRFENSKGNSILQVADIISGSLAYSFDLQKMPNAAGNDYRRILADKILRIKTFPESINEFTIPSMVTNNQHYNPVIANICYRRAISFIRNNEMSNEDETKQQIATLNYLLFRFMNKSPRNYIPTTELINQLVYLGYDRMSKQTFRTKVIARLRDNEVIIASSASGYKIPSTEAELDDFINHGKTIIMPMLSRLRKCRDVIKMGTNGEIDLFEKGEYQSLKALLEINN